MQTESNKILSDIVVHTKYARYLAKEQRRETWDEIIDRCVAMHNEKYPDLKEVTERIFNESVRTKKVLPSMRSAQFAGLPITRNPSRIYNCGYLPAEDSRFFNELMFLLLGGTGVGYSVQKRHVNQLPLVQGPSLEGRARRYVIGDSIEGWSDAIKLLVESFFEGKRRVRFDFGDIREKGVELITSGGKAPGPDPLRECLIRIGSVLHDAIGSQLTPLQVHDMACHIADAVLAGGIRRAAMIALFDHTDLEMMTCKSGMWWEENPQRGRANNSVILLRDVVSRVEFEEVWERCRTSGAGEPGIYWTWDLDWGTNPCCEIALQAYQFCNLTTINTSDIEGQEDLNKRAYAAAYIGTLQAGYTDFHYLRSEWQTATEKDALIGVSMTGVASGALLYLDLAEAVNQVHWANQEIAIAIGIHRAARATTIKPEGTASLVLGCSSGVHAWHSEFYIRRMRLGKNEAVCQYLSANFPEIIEDDYFNPTTQSVVSIPQKAPEGSILRSESAVDLFDRVILLNREWVKRGHERGENYNNVSCTLSIREEEWDTMGDLLWQYRDDYNGMALLPYDGGSYKQAPFEDITEDEYYLLEEDLRAIDLKNVHELVDNTNLTAEAACAGGSCEIV